VADKGHSRTKSEITPQYHETRQQMGDSRHNFTIHTTKKPLTDHGLNTD
jgi:hypothetical protein